MIDILDDFFTTHIQDLQTYLPDGIITVDLPLLSEMDLLDDIAPIKERRHLPQCMYAIETDLRVTLFNDYFAAWVVPYANGNDPYTLLLIAKLEDKTPRLEICFSFHGIYNQAKTILRVLDQAIYDIRETDATLTHMK